MKKIISYLYVFLLFFALSTQTTESNFYKKGSVKRKVKAYALSVWNTIQENSRIIESCILLMSGAISFKIWNYYSSFSKQEEQQKIEMKISIQNYQPKNDQKQTPDSKDQMTIAPLPKKEEENYCYNIPYKNIIKTVFDVLIQKGKEIKQIIIDQNKNALDKFTDISGEKSDIMTGTKIEQIIDTTSKIITNELKTIKENFDRLKNFGVKAKETGFDIFKKAEPLVETIYTNTSNFDPKKTMQKAKSILLEVNSKVFEQPEDPFSNHDTTYKELNNDVREKILQKGKIIKDFVIEKTINIVLPIKQFINDFIKKYN